MPTKEEAIGFVKDAIDQHNIGERNKAEPNKISIFHKIGYERHHGATSTCCLDFQTENMHRSLKIPDNPKRYGCYYGYWLQAKDDGTMTWSFVLKGQNADDTM
jgi:hypothetical protein